MDDTGNSALLIVLVVAVCVTAGIIYGATTDRNLSKEMRSQGDTASTPSPTPSPYPQPTTPEPSPPYKKDEVPAIDEEMLPGIEKNTTNSNSSLPSTNNALTPQERLDNIVIGAAMGFLVGGAIVLAGGAIACVSGYASIVVPALGMKGTQVVAWGILSYNVFPIFIAPFLGMEMEVLEYPA